MIIILAVIFGGFIACLILSMNAENAKKAKKA
jgi:hypothetical protein